MTHGTRPDAFWAVVWHDEVRCIGCLPADVSVRDYDVSPIFACEEWPSIPVCIRCGREHDYIILWEKAA